jgi:hypothetical protein
MTARHLSGRALDGAPLISMPEIAELAGVRRPVVTTWRRRHIGFPGPAEGGIASPLFDARKVVDWLVATGRADRARIEPELSLHTLATIGAQFPAGDLVATATALICLRWLDDDEPLAGGAGDIVASLNGRAARLDPADELLRSEIGQLPRGSGWLAIAIDDLVEAAWGCQGAFERIMSSRHRFQAADLYTRAVTPQLAWMVARLSGARERAARSDSILVADPAPGPGDLMTAVVELLGADHPPRCIGAEDSPYLARLVRRRLVVHGIPLPEAAVGIGAELPDEAGNPDVIVTQIPYQPQESRSAEAVLDRLGDISARLRAGATAVVLGPADVLVDALPAYSSAERARAKLLQDHMVEAVIRLPGGVAPFRPGYQTALWVLAPARESPWRGRILLADVSDLELTDQIVDELADDVLTWRRDGYVPRAHTRAFSDQVQISDLVFPPRPLTVRRSRSIHEQQADTAARVARVTQLEADQARIGASAAAAWRPVQCGVTARAADRPVLATIGALTKAGRLSMLKGTRLIPAHLDEAGQLAVLGTPELLGHGRPGQRMIDRAMIASHYPRAQLTEPGDVVVTTVPRLAAVVDHEGFSVAEFPARILRIPVAERDQFTPAVLAALLTADGDGPRPAGAVRSARRLDTHHVVLLNPDEVKLLDALLAQLDEQAALARQQIDVLTEIRNVTAGGLLAGTLALTGHGPDGTAPN